MDLVWLAQSKLRRRKFDECIEVCTGMLEKNPYDQSVWYLKCRALTLKNWIDDTEIEEEGVAEMLLDDNAIAQAPRPGTSLSRPMTGVCENAPLRIFPVSCRRRMLSACLMRHVKISN